MTDAITDPIKQKALGAYLGLACGDALGATVEFMYPKQIQAKYGSHRDIIGGGWLGLEPGYVTDDTQMSLAIGRALIESQTWDINNIAKHFVQWLDSTPPDIGDTCRRGIMRYKRDGSLSGAYNDREAGNGACMRILPVVLFGLYHEAKLDEWLIEQNHLTHNNQLSDDATLAIARIIKQLLLGNNYQTEVAQLLQQHPEFNYTPYPGKASGYIVHTIQTVLHCFENTDSFEDCMIKTVNLGGDADTTGAIVGMLAGARYGLSAIPQRWLDALSPRIYQEITQQTKALITLAKQ